MPRLSPLSLEGLRSCIRPEYAGLPAEDLERAIEPSVSGLRADIVEDFWNTLKKVGSTLAKVAPAVAQGALAGSPLRAGLAVASSLLKTKEKPAPSIAPAPAVSAPPSATGTPGMPAAPALPTGQGAAATLLSLFNNPTAQQALLSQVLGRLAGPAVRTPSGTSLPVGTINHLFTQLFANASEALPESEESESFSESYLKDPGGEYLVDPASPDQRAALVLSHLQQTRAAELRPDSDDFTEAMGWEAADVAEMESEEWPEIDESSETVSFY